MSAEAPTRRRPVARFTDSGLAFVDGARIRLVPLERLP